MSQKKRSTHPAFPAVIAVACRKTFTRGRQTHEAQRQRPGSKNKCVIIHPPHTSSISLKVGLDPPNINAAQKPTSKALCMRNPPNILSAVLRCCGMQMRVDDSAWKAAGAREGEGVYTRAAERRDQTRAVNKNTTRAVFRQRGRCSTTVQ